MKFTKLHLVYFSPTHTSRRIAEYVAEGLEGEECIKTDLTYESPGNLEIAEDTIVVMAVPVYGGRVAETALERLEKIRGKQGPVVLITVYGNRDYEDALLELRDYAVKAGFVPVAGAAFIGEHSYSREAMPIAAGRPDREDVEKAFAFGQAVGAKLAELQDLRILPLLGVKGNTPYKVKGPKTPATPVTQDELCTQCGLCIELCPTQAIELTDKVVSDPQLCIKCCACVKECPSQARVFDTPYTEMLFKHFSSRREPEVFL